VIERITLSTAGPGAAPALTRRLAGLDPATRVVVLDGALDGPVDLDPGRLHGEVDAVAAVESLPFPVVLGVAGTCSGFGLDLLLAADVVVADPAATFGPASPVGAVLARHRSWSHGRDLLALLLAGGTLSAELAHAHLLVDHLAAPLAERVDEVVERLMGAAPRSMEVARRILHRGAEADLAGARLAIDAVAEGAPW
jgi:enoyl-CoA hydratase/carnithine racemase